MATWNRDGIYSGAAAGRGVRAAPNLPYSINHRREGLVALLRGVTARGPSAACVRGAV